MNAARNLGLVDRLVGRWRPRSFGGNGAVAAGLVVRREDREATAILHLAGRLTMEEAGALREHLDEVFEDGAARLVVNLSGCLYADSAGIALLLSALQRATAVGRRFALVGVAPQVRSVLEMARLDRLFEIHRSMDDALAS